MRGREIETDSRGERRGRGGVVVVVVDLLLTRFLGVLLCMMALPVLTSHTLTVQSRDPEHSLSSSPVEGNQAFHQVNGRRRRRTTWPDGASSSIT